jgi:hypothetical protein
VAARCPKYHLRQLKRGFESLAPDDQELLREWFALPARASSADVCRKLLERAPVLVLDGILRATLKA